MTIIRPKLLIIGHARHGKDTVGEWFVKRGYTFVSSSRFVGEKAVWPIAQAWHPWFDRGDRNRMYANFEECFEDRHHHRDRWYQAIAAYNRPDRSRLGRELFAEYDMYVGLRNYHELEALRLHKAFDLCIWVDASERVGPEPTSSCTVTPQQADVIIDNNGTLDDLDKTLEVLYNKWVRPLEVNTPTTVHFNWGDNLLVGSKYYTDLIAPNGETIIFNQSKWKMGVQNGRAFLLKIA